MESATRAAWPKDNRLWQVQAIGEAHPSRGVPSELSLDVCLTWVPEPRISAPTKTKIFVKASIPQLPSLHLAQRWRNGLPVDLAPSEEFDDELDFSPDNCELVDAGEMFPNRSSPTYLIPPLVHSFSPYLRSRCLAIGYRGKRKAIIIPCAEIARCWYFRSTDLALRLTEGPLNVIGKERLFNPNYSPTILTGEWQVRVRTGLSKMDAYVVAMIRCDDYAREQVIKMTNSLVKQSVARAPRFVEARPPLVGEWPMQAQGRWFTSDGVDRFLVYYLTGIQYPTTPPGQLHWNLDNTNQVLEIEEGDPRPPKKKNSWPKQGDPRGATSKDHLGNDAEPDSGTSPIHEAVIMADFIGAPSLRRMDPERQQTETVPGKAKTPPPEGPASTGEGGNRPGNPTRLKIHADRVSAPTRTIMPHSFKRTIDVMNLLNKESALQCRIVRGSKDITGDSAEPRSLFRTTSSTASGESNPWVLVDGRARQFLVIEMELDGKYAYAIEVERRRNKETGEEKEKYTLAIAVGEEAAKLSLGQFGILAAVCARKKGVWPKAYNSLRIAKLRHQYSTPRTFANGIEAAVIKLVPSLKTAILAARPTKQKKGKKKAAKA